MWNPINFSGYPIYDTGCDIGVLEFAAQTSLALAGQNVDLSGVGSEIQSVGEEVRASMVVLR